MRLDQLLTERGLTPSRSRARDLILRGLVHADGRVVLRPGAAVAEGAEITIAEDWSGYVSRGALKLAAGLDSFGFDPAGRVALDVGASTGGFTQLLLRRGAAAVYAVDVGQRQLHASLRNEPRVTALENTDARTLSPDLIPQPVGAITVDVSFISLTKVLPAAFALAAPGAWAVLLVKPQFEAGREAVGKGGIVRGGPARAQALAGVMQFVDAQPGWRSLPPIASPIAGGSGNLEFLLGAVHGD
jgi:23S rRNA (cytidine1920-2'-O)/16S rRNA (cytidine1409-2'-O)-methyltransferase